MERICLPKLNMILERQYFRCLEQEEDKSINSYEDRVRSKALLCGYNNCKCDPTCKMCDFSREDKIMTQILCTMWDKELQKELWRKEESFKTLDQVLGAIRASEAATENQTAAASQAPGSNQTKIKCYTCDKIGHSSKNCPNKKY